MSLPSMENNGRSLSGIQGLDTYITIQSDLKNEREARGVFSYTQLMGTAHPTVLRVITRQLEQLTLFYGRIQMGKASASQIKESILNIQDSIKIYQKRQELLSKPDEICPLAGNTKITNREHVLGSPVMHPNHKDVVLNSTDRFNDKIEILKQSIMPLKNAYFYKNCCEKIPLAIIATSGVIAIAAIIGGIGISYFANQGEIGFSSFYT